MSDAERSRDPNLATFALYDWYEALTPEERALADHVLLQWVDADDGGRRFDALALIHKFSIRSALAAVEQLSHRLQSVEGPEARFLRAKVSRLIDHLGGPSR